MSPRQPCGRNGNTELHIQRQTQRPPWRAAVPIGRPFDATTAAASSPDQELADNPATPFPAYTLFGIALDEGSVAVPEWSDEELVNSTRQCLFEAKACIDSNHPLRSINAFMELGAAFNVDIQKRVPDTAWNFWTERMTLPFSPTRNGRGNVDCRSSHCCRRFFVIGGQTLYQLA